MTQCISPLLVLFGSIFISFYAEAGLKKKASDPNKHELNEALLDGMNFRQLGPFRGGRSAAVCGVPGQPSTFFFGGTGGGVWKTRDGGSHWQNISDGFFGGSIGAVAISTSDPNVIYVGGGEVTIRGNVSHGEGIYRSLDGGKTWSHVGLSDSRHIPRIQIHPKNSKLIYAAVLGHLSGPNEERGVFRSRDGGETWKKILFVSNEAGAVDLIMDPSNPRILFASFWKVKRTPYSLESGGEGSSLWKTTDGGDTWQAITGSKNSGNGLPETTLGIIGVSVSAADPNRIWAMVEAEEGGLFRSDDGGKKWSRVNQERSLRQRAWYYTRIYSDPIDADIVYVLNVRFWKSTDGGKTFKKIDTPHGDHHDLWIDPVDPERMIIGDDGGAQVTYDGGQRWSTYHNQPTAQFYRVTTDNSFPYRIYGAQQDNSTVRLRHRTRGSRITASDWEPTAGGESGHIAPHPEDPDIVYGGSYGGFLTRVNHRTKERRNVQVWPDNPMGHGAENLKYRFQWNFPVFFSPHDPTVLYAAGNILFKSIDEGQSWKEISPDLTTNDKSKQGSSGGPITQDNTSVEYYCTIFSAAESPLEPGVIWTGSDDGLVHVTRNGGETWENVTPPSLPKWAQINSIEMHPAEKGSVYFAATRYKLNDIRPYLYKTTNYGRTWVKITLGIPEHHFTRVIRAVPESPGLLFCGTENGLYLSTNDGQSWQSFQQNLPIVPITDLAVKDRDLIIATQGRSFWIMDDVTPLFGMSAKTQNLSPMLYPPRPTWRFSGMTTKKPGNAGSNLQGGVLVQYYLPHEINLPVEEKKPEKEPGQELILTILDAQGTLIREFSTSVTEEEAKKGTRGRLEARKGHNIFVWDMRLADAKSFKDMVIWSGNMKGPVVLPGEYQVRLELGDYHQSYKVQLMQKPKTQASFGDLELQYEFLVEVRDKLTETHRGIQKTRKMKAQIKTFLEHHKSNLTYSDVVKACESLIEKITAIEERLYQTKNQSRQDPLNYPIRLNDRLAGVKSAVGTGDYPPTNSAIAVKNELVEEIDTCLLQLQSILDIDLPELNKAIHEKQIPTFFLKNEEG